MEQQPLEKRKKLKQAKSANVNDSCYGSMITGTSSSSSLSLSLFSESDLAEAPSTSGCSSEMASAMQSKEKKKERAKEFMKKLKSMLPMKERTGKMDTLSTLEQLVNSMRQLNEEQKRHSEFKTPPPHSGSYHGNDSERLSHSNMFISVSLKNHVVLSASPALMEHLGYPVDWWKGRLLKDFLNKKDTNMVNSCVAQHSNDEDHTETSVGIPSTTGAKEGSKYFYARIRRFRKLGNGFNLHNIVSYCHFMMMITTKPLEQSDSSDDDSFKHRKALTIYCQPLTSAYEDGHLAPEKWKFSLRHSLFCNYTYVHPNAVRLLGFLPQDLNGMSIFELYHPEDFHQLLEIHKKIILSMGQPFKSGTVRLRTRNGSFVEVETEWSSFINPWSKRLEFIIGQHTVLKGPSRPDLFEDLPYKPEKLQLSPEVRKIQENILEVLNKPVQGVFAEPSPVIQTVKETSKFSAVVQKSTTAQGANREVDTTAKAAAPADKPKGEAAAATESKSAVLDEKGILSIYNQLNYSHKIKRFLMSHPKSFSNVSDEESVVTREDSEDEAINDEEEMPLEIPVVKPPSCGSSTQVHVSEIGHGEEMLSPPTFGDEAMPPRDCGDNIHLLTEEALKKHTRLQERLYLQTISEEQPPLLNMRRLKSSKNTSLQKRPRPREVGEEVEVAKHPCTNSGVFRSSSNIFMQSFPAVSSCELTSVTPTSQPLYRQSEMVAPYDSRFLGQSPQIGFQPFQSGYQTGSQGSLAIPPQPTIHLVPGDSAPLSYIPTGLGQMIQNMGHYDIRASLTGGNIQWPNYPQTGYTLMPQVMAGHYRPLHQPVQVQALPTHQGAFIKGKNVGIMMSKGPIAHNDGHLGKPAKKIKMDRFDKKHQDSDNPSSSMDDTTSSIMYLLEDDSFTFEDSDNKASSGIAPGTKQNKRSLEPPWLRGVKWNSDTKMRYQMPLKKSFSVLKMDEKFLKKNQQNDMALVSLEQLLEDIGLPDHEDPMDEEADYLFFPGDESLDPFDIDDEKTEEIDLTQSSSHVVEGGGVCGNGGTAEDVWNLGASENDDESYDTPVNSHSEDEKSPPTRAEINGGENVVKQEVGADLTGSKQVGEEHGDVAMETVFIRNSQTAGNSPLIKRGASPKYGSLSGDEGGGQKAEIDAQSNCSKVSSDLTPSDDRSNEEVGSSMKESDSSTKKMKGVSSVASSNSSNDHTSQEEGSGGSLAKDGEDLIKKLFVPLKVKVSKRLSTPSTPYWLVEAHLSPKVAMTYKISTRQLEDVLNEDKRKMTDLVQSATVKQQVLQLLNEIDLKSGTTVAKTMSSATMCPASYSKPCTMTRMKQPSSLSDSAFGGTITEEEQCNTDEKMTNRVDLLNEETALKVKPILSANKPVVSSTDTSYGVGAQGLVKSETNNSLCEKTSHITLAKSTSSISMESVQGQFHAEMTRYRNHRPVYTNSSDTNTDSIGDEPRARSFYTSQSSTADSASTVYSVRGGPARTDAHLQEKLQALESGGNLTGQKIEDIIMSKVFVPVDTLSTNPEAKPVPSIFIAPE
ncbi:unnamed protein product [Lymnaea stagnalis]|uniref:PAS domain-containing protein n=1 Tax=Lymnaea stagnalis TaxID=6523 RepID=A0AAV2H0Q8_LYMST